MSKNSRIILSILTIITTSFGIPVTDLSYKISGTSLEWPGANARNIYKTNGRYVPRNIIATRHQIYKDEAIIVFPRYKHGIPLTLGVVKLSKKNANGKAIVAPFPSWSLQEEGSCESFQNVVDIVLDNRDILWILDIGIVDTLEEPIRRCPPKIVAVYMKSKKIVRTIDLSNFVTPESRLQYLAIDNESDGKMYIYVSDAATRSIIVYNVLGNYGDRIILPKAVTVGSSHPDVLYINLIKKRSDSSVLYFTYLGSNRMFSIKGKHLKSNVASGSIVDVGSKKSKIVLLGTHDDNALFFRKKGQSDIYMWNVDSNFTPDNFILVQRGNDYRLPTHVVTGYKRLMWVLESNFPDYIQNTVGCSGTSVILHPLAKSSEYL